MEINKPLRHHKNNARLGIFVARTIDKRDRKIPLFMHQLAGLLRAGVSLKDPTATHLTFLDNYGLASRLDTREYTSDDIAALGQRLEAEIRRKIPSRETSVAVDAENPIGLYGKRNNLIGLRIVKSTQLLEQRELIACFIDRELGYKPSVNRFNPHIALGTLWGATLRQFQGNLENILPAGFAPPQRVALNGLNVYLGSVHSSGAMKAAA